jgi:hypothetical protein
VGELLEGVLVLLKPEELDELGELDRLGLLDREDDEGEERLNDPPPLRPPLLFASARSPKTPIVTPTKQTSVAITKICSFVLRMVLCLNYRV